MPKIRKVKSPEEEEEELEELGEKKVPLKKKEGPPKYKFRYLASIQDTKNPSLFFDFSEDSSLSKLKEKVEKEISEVFENEGSNLGGIIQDRESLICFYRYNLPPRPEVAIDGRGQRRIVNKEEITIRKKTWIKEE